MLERKPKRIRRLFIIGERQYQVLSQLSQLTGYSVNEYVRQGIDLVIEKAGVLPDRDVLADVEPEIK